MTELDSAELDDVDFAVVAYLLDDEWELDDLPDTALGQVQAVAEELRQYPDPGALAMISVGEDFALLVRREDDQTLLVLSDVSAATEWSLARSAADHLGLEVDDDAEPAAVGSLGLLADVGLPAADLVALIDDEPHPEDLLVSVADELGFGEAFEDLLDDDEDDSEDDSEEPDPLDGEDDELDEGDLEGDDHEGDLEDDDLEEDLDGDEEE